MKKDNVKVVYAYIRYIEFNSYYDSVRYSLSLRDLGEKSSSILLKSSKYVNITDSKITKVL